MPSCVSPQKSNWERGTGIKGVQSKSQSSTLGSSQQTPPLHRAFKGILLPDAAHSHQFWADLETLCLILPGINIFYISRLARKTRLHWTFVTWSQWGYYLVTQGQILSFQFWQGNGLRSLSSQSETQIFNSGFHVIISHAWLFEISHQDKNKKDVPTNENKYSDCFMNMDSNDKKETSKASQDFLSLIIQFFSKVSYWLENRRFKCCRLSKGKMSSIILFANTDFTVQIRFTSLPGFHDKRSPIFPRW